MYDIKKFLNENMEMRWYKIDFIYIICVFANDTKTYLKT
jgi:hypothetical protein